ncbi:hypothetical protein ERJ75_001447300 [Trypanosoma vivax]|uniref:Putative flagellar antigen n=1 Tax=Trypanosoma vivax (strain Y486) TaxID=1055687 RepID=G0U819_TRYVY|nr:putative flagellar antigen [Trypanosoma vivax]KAH8607022.1 hypothetical protein ERJ75_001447300 [Trypanosoma vivax]CCC52028.1 putative flagellar antigen [Trypanosoma vivax Y486]
MPSPDLSARSIQVAAAAGVSGVTTDPVEVTTMGDQLEELHASQANVEKPISLKPSKPGKPDYFPLSAFRRPMGPAVHPGAAAAEDRASGYLADEVVHDMTFYTEVSRSLPDNGQPVLNSIFFSQRHIVNDGPSVDDEIACIDENIRQYRASRLQDVITNYEHTREKAEIEGRVATRIERRGAAERDRTISRINRMIDTVMPRLERSIAETADEMHQPMSVLQRERLARRLQESKDTQESALRDLRTAERRKLIERQYDRHMDERIAVDTQHYFSYLNCLSELRSSYLDLHRNFHDGRMIVGIVEDEKMLRLRMEGNEMLCRGDIVEEIIKARSYIEMKRKRECGESTEADNGGATLQNLPGVSGVTADGEVMEEEACVVTEQQGVTVELRAKLDTQPPSRAQQLAELSEGCPQDM